MKQVYSEASATFTAVTQSGAITKSFPQTYPGLSLLPGGEVFYTPTGFGNCGTGSIYSLNDPSAYFVFSAPQGATSGTWTNIGGVTNRTKGMCAILLQPAFPFVRVIVVGGGDATSNATAQTVNLSTLSPSWGPASSIPDGRARTNVNTVLLPDGTVFVCGGTQAAPHTCYIYNPNTAVNAWRQMDELNAPRHYHSCALLLPNAKVMVAGGAAAGGCTASVENTIEVFSPPYLFNADGTVAARPAIATIDGVAPSCGGADRSSWRDVRDRVTSGERHRSRRARSSDGGHAPDGHRAARDPVRLFADRRDTAQRGSSERHPSSCDRSPWLLSALHSDGKRRPVRGTVHPPPLSAFYWVIAPFGAIVNAKPGSSPLPGVVAF